MKIPPSLSLPRKGGGKTFAARSFDLTWSESGASPDGQTGIIRADPAAWGDVVLARKDAPDQLSSRRDGRRCRCKAVTDGDARARPVSLRPSVHRLLQALLGLPAPRYHHHRAASSMPRARSCRNRPPPPALRELRAKGVSPEEIRRLVGLG